MPDANRPLYSIGAVARMLDLRPGTIRTWEARYGEVVPERSRGGQRLYSRAQVDQLRFLRDEVAGGSRPAQAHRLLAERAGSTAVPVRVAAPGALAQALLSQMLAADGFLLADDADAALAVVGVEDAAGADLCGRLRAGGQRVLALVAPDAGHVAADAVLRLPVSVDELLQAARALARR